MNNISKNQRQIKVFVASAVFIAFTVSTLSSIVVQEFYTAGNIGFSLFLVLFLIFSIMISYEFIASEGMRKKKAVDFLFTFDKNEETFLDIAHHAPSVHSRVFWNSLTPEHRKHLATLDTPHGFFGSDLSKLTDNVVLYYIIMIIVRNSGWKNQAYKEVNIEDLPFFIQSIERIGVDTNPIFNIPESVSIKRLESESPFVEFESPYGSLSIRWQYEYGMKAGISQPFLVSKMGDCFESCHDIIVKLECESKIRHWRMIGKSSKEYSEWVENIFSRLEESSWAVSERKLELYLLSQLFNKSE